MIDHIVNCSLFEKIYKPFFLKHICLDFLDKTKVRRLAKKLDLNFEYCYLFEDKLKAIINTIKIFYLLIFLPRL